MVRIRRYQVGASRHRTFSAAFRPRHERPRQASQRVSVSTARPEGRAIERTARKRPPGTCVPRTAYLRTGIGSSAARDLRQIRYGSAPTADAELPPPLTPAVFHILLALADVDRHGYGIASEVSRRPMATSKIGPGTLYGGARRGRREAGTCRGEGALARRGGFAAPLLHADAGSAAMSPAPKPAGSTAGRCGAHQGPPRAETLMARLRDKPAWARQALVRHLKRLLVAAYQLGGYREEARPFLDDAVEAAWAARGWRGMFDVAGVVVRDLHAGGDGKGCLRDHCWAGSAPARALLEELTDGPLLRGCPGTRCVP